MIERTSEVVEMAAQEVAAPVSCELRVRYGECDPQGVVFNANYLAYFDIAFTELIREAFGGYEAMVERGIDFVVAEAGLRFRRPAHFDDELTVAVSVGRLGTTSMTTNYRVLRDEEVLVEGTVRHVAIDPKLLLEREQDPKAEIPGWMRESLGPFPEPGLTEPLAQ